MSTEAPLPDLEDRLTGALLGTALGDALGLPAEGMSGAAIRRRWGAMDRFHLLGRRGYVSDDTEQSALLAQSLIRSPQDPGRCADAFRRSLVGWFARLPFGVGLATIRACSRAAFGLRPSGVPSAGNGAAMRAAPLGVFFRSDSEARNRFSRALATVTHTDARAVDGARFVAEVAAGCATALSQADRARIVTEALELDLCEPVRQAVRSALELAERDANPETAAASLGTSGFVIHTVGFATFAFLRAGEDPLKAVQLVIAAGGDTDSIAAIVGAWVGALHGAAALPELVDRIHNGPFGPDHLRRLGRALARTATGEQVEAPRYFAPAALARNLALMPVILAHGFRRLAP